MNRVRRAPPLWILLDILMLMVLALISVPIKEPGAIYKFVGLPSGGVVFEVEKPIQPSREVWRHFDLSRNEWVESSEVTPHGLDNYLCDACAGFLPENVDLPDQLMIGLPEAISDRIHSAFFESCTHGDCSPTIYIRSDGSVSLKRAAAGQGERTS